MWGMNLSKAFYATNTETLFKYILQEDPSIHARTLLIDAALQWLTTLF